VDSLTHALIIAVILAAIGRPDLLPYGIMGAVLIDVDVVFNLFSDRDPRLYIFTHGGFTHSFLGAFIISACISVLSVLASFTGWLPAFTIAALAAIVIGALSHISIDYLAYPGIPLFYPLSDQKHTAGVMGGPSAFIMAGTIVYLALILLGKAGLEQSWAYIVFFGAVLGLCAGTKCYASLKTHGRTIATMNPFKWLVIEDNSDAYRLYAYDFFGKPSPGYTFEKYKGIDRADAERYSHIPELRRLRYHSYIVTVEKNGVSITYRDPIRENNYIWYPPYFKKLSVPAMEA
jgi:inner membrane protein